MKRPGLCLLLADITIPIHGYVAGNGFAFRVRPSRGWRRHIRKQKSKGAR